MTELPISSPYRSTPQAPVSDAERATVNGRLNEAFSAGSLDELDYQQRLDTLYAATTLGELVPVVSGLPEVATYAEPAIVSQQGQPGVLATTVSDGARAATARISLLVVGIIIGVVVLAAVLIALLVVNARA